MAIIIELSWTLSNVSMLQLKGIVVVREMGADGLEVWNSLRLMENTPALKYQWQQSHCNDLLLRAINIDARNIVSAGFSAALERFYSNSCYSHLVL